MPVTDDQRVALERLARSTSARHRTVQRARALLLAADGVANNEIARRVDVSANSILPSQASTPWRRMTKADTTFGEL